MLFEDAISLQNLFLKCCMLTIQWTEDIWTASVITIKLMNIEPFGNDAASIGKAKRKLSAFGSYSFSHYYSQNAS
jgi:hypothetical protein